VPMESIISIPGSPELRGKSDVTVLIKDIWQV
jgi:hypothetical protein